MKLKERENPPCLRSAVAKAVGATAIVASALVAAPASASLFLVGDTFTYELTVNGETVTSDIEVTGLGRQDLGLDAVDTLGGADIRTLRFDIFDWSQDEEDAVLDFNLQLLGLAVGSDISLMISDLDWIGLDGEIVDVLGSGTGIDSVSFTQNSLTFEGVVDRDGFFTFGPEVVVDFELTPIGVPEPKTLPMLALGLTGVWLLRRWRGASDPPSGLSPVHLA
ncbi:MAG: PEP-CTERM sorting domain-containing protein [Pseudomonadota bacterium]